MRTIWPLFILAGFSVFGVTVSPTFAENEAPIVSFQAKNVDYAINPETGDLAAIDADQNTLTLYKSQFFGLGERPPDGKAIGGPIKVGNSPSAIVYKKYKSRGVWAVVCMKDAHMYLADATTLELLRKIPLSGSDISRAYTSRNPADPFVYYIYGGEGGEANARVSLAKLADEGVVFHESTYTAISASGRLFYKQRNGSPSGFECWAKTEGAGEDGKPGFEQVFEEHTSTKFYLPDPHEQFVFAGINGLDVYNADLSRKVGQLNFEPRCVFAERPVVAGVIENDLLTASYNNFKTTARRAFPIGFLVEKQDAAAQPAAATAPAKGSSKARAVRQRQVRPDEQHPSPVRLLPDDKNGRVVALLQDRAVVIPLESLGLPDEALLLARVQTPEMLPINEPARMAVQKLDKRITCEISEGPDGLTLDGDWISWTPNDEQIGPHRVMLRLVHGDIERQQPVDLQVIRPSVVLPFAPFYFVLSNDGTRALCWAPADEERGRGWDRSTTTRLAVVDLEKLAVVAQATLPFRVGDGGIDDTCVYVTQAGSGTLQALAVANLTRKKQVINPEPIVKIAVVGKTLYAAAANTTHLAYELPDLKRAAAFDLRKPPEGNGPWSFRRGDLAPGEQVVARTRGGWLLDGIVYSDDLKEVKLIGDLPGMVTVGEDPQRDRAGEDRLRKTAWGTLPRELVHNPWDRSPEDKNLVEGMVLMDLYPVQLVLRRTVESVRSNRNSLQQGVSLRLEARDLLAGQVKQQVLLARQMENFQRRDPYPIGRQRQAVQVIGSMVIAVHEKQLFKYMFPKPEADTYPAPVHFEQIQSAKVISSKEKTKLTHLISGGEKPYHVILNGASDELTIDAETATVVVDGRALTTRALELLFGDTRGGVAYTVPLDAHLQMAKPAFQKTVGKDPTGIPVAVPIRMRLTDANSQSAELQYYVFLDVPQQEYKKKMEAKQVQDRKREKERREEERQFTKREIITDLPEVPRNNNLRLGGDVAVRMKKLEDRMKSIEERLDSITRLLSDRTDPQPDRKEDPRGEKSANPDEEKGTTKTETPEK